MTGIPRLVPLFPLPNVVLFPGMSLPLHIFEPRYRKMVSDATEGQKTIGMVLLRPGWEADYHGRPPIYPVGCAGSLQDLEPLPNGRLNIVLRGITRFRIVEEHAGEPYRIATVEPLPDGGADPVLLDEARRALMAAIGRATDGPAQLVLQNELPHDIFVNAVCQSLDLTPVERQSLLDCDTILGRYDRLVAILDFRVLEQTWSHGETKIH